MTNIVDSNEIMRTTHKYKVKWVSQEQNGVISLFTQAKDCTLRGLLLMPTIGRD